MNENKIEDRIYCFLVAMNAKKILDNKANEEDFIKFADLIVNKNPRFKNDNFEIKLVDGVNISCDDKTINIGKSNLKNLYSRFPISLYKFIFALGYAVRKAKQNKLNKSIEFLYEIGDLDSEELDIYEASLAPVCKEEIVNEMFSLLENYFDENTKFMAEAMLVSGKNSLNFKDFENTNLSRLNCLKFADKFSSTLINQLEEGGLKEQLKDLETMEKNIKNSLIPSEETIKESRNKINDLFLSFISQDMNDFASQNIDDTQKNNNNGATTAIYYFIRSFSSLKGINYDGCDSIYMLREFSKQALVEQRRKELQKEQSKLQKDFEEKE